MKELEKNKKDAKKMMDNMKYKFWKIVMAKTKKCREAANKARSNAQKAEA